MVEAVCTSAWVKIQNSLSATTRIKSLIWKALNLENE